MTELKDQLSLLGRKTEYRQNYAPEVLEAFDNKHPGNDYWVRFNCPEFTSLCPITGQPAFAEIRCVSTAPNSPASVPSRGNRTLQKSVFAISPMSRW